MAKENRTEFIRVIKDRNYTVLHNQFLKRNDLSWKAKGILAYILSLPDDWNINLKEVMTHATEGEKAFRSGWKELKDLGYVDRRPIRDDDTKKITHWETIVRESVDVTTNEPLTQNLHVGKEDVGNLHVDNDNLLSTDSTKYLSKQNTNNRKGRKYSFDDTQFELAKLLWEKIKVNFPNNKEPNLEAWANDIRLMMEQDNRTVAEIKGVINWSQKHEFWYANIQSARTLRAKYETMYAQADREKKQSKPKVRKQETLPDWATEDTTEHDEVVEDSTMNQRLEQLRAMKAGEQIEETSKS